MTTSREHARYRAGLRSRPRAGFGIVELLVAAAIGGVVLAASWGWLWTIGSAAARVDDGAQSGSTAAAALRGVARDVRLATAVLPPPDGRDPVRCLLLQHDEPGRAPEAVLIVWDPVRAVLWRNASGTYVSDHVTRFSVAYITSDGRRVSAAEVGPGEWSGLRLVCVELEAVVGGRLERRTLELRPGPA
jgi:type II secretory pathway component PulJ